MTDPSISAKTVEQVAKAFHDAYERLAPDFGYRTREESAEPWDEVPENNRRLMVATVHELLESGELVPASWANSSEHPNWESGWKAGRERGQAERDELRAERDDWKIRADERRIETDELEVEIHNLRIERDRLKAEKERLMEELNTSQLETIEFQKRRDALQDAIAEHRKAYGRASHVPADLALYAKAEAIKRGET